MSLPDGTWRTQRLLCRMGSSQSTTPMPNPVVAVVGAGFIGPVHVEALRRLGLVVKGVLGISIEESKAAASKLGLAMAYPDLKAVLADPEVTSVHVASPIRLHKEHVLAVLAAGKHVV